MFNAIKLFLILMMLVTSPLSLANSCDQSCKNEAYQYIDQKVPAEDWNVRYMCGQICQMGEYSCFSEVSIAETAQTFKGKPEDYANQLCKSLREERREQKAQKRAVDKEKFKARLREHDRKHEERMAAIRSQQNQPAPQARTQTTQNNYPSDNTYEQNSSNEQSSSNSSRSVGSSSVKETTEGVNQCVSVEPDKYGSEVFRNICNIKLTLYWCVDSECTSNDGRLLTNLKPNGKYNVMRNNKSYFYGACPAPYLPNERPNGTFDGKSYICEKP